MPSTIGTRKPVIIGKTDAKQNPAKILTRHVATSGEMLGSLGGLGVIDLPDKRFQEHVRQKTTSCVKRERGKVETAHGIENNIARTQWNDLAQT